ncbi:MAG TPA: MoxR family ATPase, partial [bacterium]|nr:MoxR family ATPase [bacterium]
MAGSNEELSQEGARLSEQFQKAREEVGKVIVGQDGLLDRLMLGLLARGHLLLEGLPGLAKTLAVKTLSEVLGVSFSRLQFTPDLLPADLLGTRIYNPAKGDFKTQKGPVFANLVLADEINRAPAKVQSALLEAMQEHQVTIGPDTFPLEGPFFVMATQNPIEHEGTYPLPEAQVDRFLMKVLVGYPTPAEEKQIITRMAGGESPQVREVLSASAILKAQKAVDGVLVSETLKDYIVSLVGATRAPKDYRLDSLAPMIEYGASPRASLGLSAAAKARAFLDGRGYATPEDVKALAGDLLRHRLILTYEAEAQNVKADSLIDQIL